MHDTELTAERARELLAYDPMTGELNWKVARCRGKIPAGAAAGWPTKKGCLVRIDGKTHNSHRVVWLITHGEWPKGLLDHRDRVNTNNRIKNLRDTNETVNAQNIERARSHNRAGILGVTFSGTKFKARITVDGADHYLGTFATKDEAQAVYMKAKHQLHPGYVALAT